ncbi:MAG: hypothetical protein WBV82_30800 [Myxococcaceae bacterium]
MLVLLRRCCCIIPLSLFLFGFDGGTDGGEPDAGELSFPDGSVGEGGADRDQPESLDSVGRVTTVCTSHIECDRGFVCEDRRCRWQGIRKADGGFGCGGMVVTALLFPLAAGAWVRRRGARGRSP